MGGRWQRWLRAHYKEGGEKWTEPRAAEGWGCSIGPPVASSPHYPFERGLVRGGVPQRPLRLAPPGAQQGPTPHPQRAESRPVQPRFTPPWLRSRGVSSHSGHLRAFTFHFHALEKEMATHSSVLAWRIPGMGEPGGLLSVGSHRVGEGGRVGARGWGSCYLAGSRV